MLTNCGFRRKTCCRCNEVSLYDLRVDIILTITHYVHVVARYVVWLATGQRTGTIITLMTLKKDLQYIRLNY